MSRPSTLTRGGTRRRPAPRSPKRPTTPPTTDGSVRRTGARAPRGGAGPARRDRVEPVRTAHEPHRPAVDRARPGARPRAGLQVRGAVVRAGPVEPAAARAGDVRARRVR